MLCCNCIVVSGTMLVLCLSRAGFVLMPGWCCYWTASVFMLEQVCNGGVLFCWYCAVTVLVLRRCCFGMVRMVRALLMLHRIVIVVGAILKLY